MEENNAAKKLEAGRVTDMNEARVRRLLSLRVVAVMGIVAGIVTFVADNISSFGPMLARISANPGFAIGWAISVAFMGYFYRTNCRNAFSEKSGGPAVISAFAALYCATCGLGNFGSITIAAMTCTATLYGFAVAAGIDLAAKVIYSEKVASSVRTVSLLVVAYGIFMSIAGGLFLLG